MSSVNERRNKAERTSEVAFNLINDEAAAREAKSAKLRKLREAQEATGAPEPSPDDKPAPKKRLITRKPRQVGPQ